MKLREKFEVGARLPGSIVAEVLNKAANLGDHTKHWVPKIEEIQDIMGNVIGQKVAIILCRRRNKRETVVPGIIIDILEPILYTNGYQFLEAELTVTGYIRAFIFGEKLREELKKIGQQFTVALSQYPKHYHVFESKTIVIPK